MPANRSRTLEWRRCLTQIRDRGGTIEIAIAHNESEQSVGNLDLVWRVKVLELHDDRLVVEQPIAMGQSIELKTGIRLVGLLTIGQNRWEFATKILVASEATTSYGKSVPALQLATPQSVKRCMRRKHDRLNTSNVQLPRVEVWPLYDPQSAVLAERAVELRMAEGESIPSTSSQPEDAGHATMPDVGPRFLTTMMNIGGGGLGLLVDPDDAHILAHHNLFWFRFTLPGLVAPICAVGKIVHTHIESTQQTYAGIAFDFSFNPNNQRIVVDQICRYIASQQREQLRQSA